MKQISFLDHPELIKPTRYSAKTCPLHTAQSMGLLPERSFDNLDYFDFLGLKVKDVLLGIRRHRGNTSGWSYISLCGYDGRSHEQFIAAILSIPVSDVTTLDEDW